MPSLSFDVSPLDGGAGVSAVTLNADFTYVNTSRAVAAAIANSKSPIFDEVKDLANGDNIITLPVTPRAPGGVIILPPQESTYTWQITDGTDVALKMNKWAPALICFDQDDLLVHFHIDWNGPGYKAASVTLDATDDEVDHAAHTLIANDRIRFDETSGALPTELSLGTWYYVRSPAAGVYELALEEDGDQVLFTSAGTTVKVTSADRFHFYWF